MIKKNKANKKENKWFFIVFLLTFSLCLMFSSFSEVILNKNGAIISVVVIIIFLVISILFDMVGVAVTACDEEKIKKMGQNKKGFYEAKFLLRNCDKVASFCCDIVGDICGILSGSASASIVLKLMLEGDSLSILFSIIFSSLVASLTVFGKALGKKFAIKNSERIVLRLGKTISLFSKKQK